MIRKQLLKAISNLESAKAEGNSKLVMYWSNQVKRLASLIERENSI